MRLIKNKLSREYIKLEKEAHDVEELERMGQGALRKAVVEGDVEYGNVMAGQICGMLQKEESAKEIINSLITEFIETIKKSGEFIG